MDSGRRKQVQNGIDRTSDLTEQHGEKVADIVLLKAALVTKTCNKYCYMLMYDREGQYINFRNIMV
jgi:hypothetical protein